MKNYIGIAILIVFSWLTFTAYAQDARQIALTRAAVYTIGYYVGSAAKQAVTKNPGLIRDDNSYLQGIIHGFNSKPKAVKGNPDFTRGADFSQFLYKDEFSQRKETLKKLGYFKKPICCHSEKCYTRWFLW